MKLPFHHIIGPIIKPYLGTTRLFCQGGMFMLSVPYTYFYSTLGIIISASHLRTHLGEVPVPVNNEPSVHTTADNEDDTGKDTMLVHDLRVIATTMGLVQHTCLLIGCLTENPALFLPHLLGQLLVVVVKTLNAFLTLASLNQKNFNKLLKKVPAVILLTFNWFQEFCVFRQYLEGTYLVIHHINSSNLFVIHCRPVIYSLLFALPNILKLSCFDVLTIDMMNCVESSDGMRMRLRALLVALLGISVSACAFASQPVELELDDEEVAKKLNNVSFARRITKPTIRLVMGYGKLSAIVTAGTSLLLLVAVMSKQAWWRHGARWLAAPALLVAALEAASDTGDAMIAAVLRGSTQPGVVAAQTAAAAAMVTVEILVWYFIAKFFEYNPPQTAEEKEKEQLIKSLPQ